MKDFTYIFEFKNKYLESKFLKLIRRESLQVWFMTENDDEKEVTIFLFTNSGFYEHS